MVGVAPSSRTEPATGKGSRSGGACILAAEVDSRAADCSWRNTGTWLGKLSAEGSAFRYGECVSNRKRFCQSVVYCLFIVWGCGA